MLRAALALALALSALPAAAQESSVVEPLDRVAVRWHAAATGGVERPQFIMARQLAFEARIEALAESGARPGAEFGDKHVRAALQRHVAETILATLPVTPAPTPKEIAGYAEEARRILEEQVGGRQALNSAADAEGLSAEELNAWLRRRARASWYLDRMVAPMLRPSDIDLREAHQRGESPYTGQRYEDVEEPLRRWYISTRLARAVDTYFRSIRAKVTIRLVVP